MSPSLLREKMSYRAKVPPSKNLSPRAYQVIGIMIGQMIVELIG